MLRFRATRQFLGNSWESEGAARWRPLLTARIVWLRGPAITDIKHTRVRDRFDLDALHGPATTCRQTSRNEPSLTGSSASPIFRAVGSRQQPMKALKALLSVILLCMALVALSPSGGGWAAPPYLFVFNMDSDDVTIIDPTTHQVLGTRPVGFKVKWLADHMQSFDGTLLWTYGLRTEHVGGTDVTKVDVIAFDPVALRVVKRQEVGRGPAHSVVLTPDRKQVLMNVAGDDLSVYIDPATPTVAQAVPVGKCPCDLHLPPDGRTAYLPERDQDPVSALDVARRQIVKRVSFAKGSKPHMLRVSPDGKYVWVQDAVSN